jgi:hypothetical protein
MDRKWFHTTFDGLQNPVQVHFHILLTLMLTVGSDSLLFMLIPLQLHHLIYLPRFPLTHPQNPLQITLLPQRHWSVTETLQIDILLSRHEQLQ